MIQTFRDKETERIFNREVSKKLPPNIQRVSLRKLLWIHGAKVLTELNVPPSNRLEKLKGSRKGQHSIRINDQWRICFKWDNGNVFDVEITDYH